ncbi:FAD/NAD-P-binding domain-containing protein [Peniophora sp. CONT]|nr:FAD/NAD-P-binding domain-containing protein [Peniophora sp. CONT]
MARARLSHTLFILIPAAIWTVSGQACALKLARIHMKLRTLLSVSVLGGIASAEQIVLDAASTNSPYTTFPHPIKRVAVIGAGPSGLQVAAELQDHKFNVTLFDRAPGPGGNWRFTDDVPVRESYPDAPVNLSPYVPNELPHVEKYTDGQDGRSIDERWREHWVPRPVWQNLHTNSPISITDLPGVPYPPNTPWSPSKDTVTAHVRGYAAIHGFAFDDDPAVVSYNTRVERVDKSDNKWILTLKRFRKLEETNRLEATWWKEEFDAVVVASANLDSDQPHVPDTPGIVEWSKVVDEKSPTGYSIYHSRSYRRPEHYANKTVLVVGASVSGSEIARDIAPYVKTLYISRKAYDWEKLHPYQRRSFKRLPATANLVPEIASFEPLEGREIQSGKIAFVNGSTLALGVDEIIFATGYVHVNRFLAQVSHDTRPTELFRSYRNTHWTGHYIPDPTIAFTNSRPWTTTRYQALGIAKIWEGTAHLPNEAELWRQYNTTRYRSFWGLPGTEPSQALERQWVTWLNNESLENGGALVENWPFERREQYTHYMNLATLEPYIFLENFTRFDNVPASEWGRTNGYTLQDVCEEKLEHEIVEYGLW